MSLKTYEWTKRLGQQHLSMNDSSTTLCGKPMLGNNYATVLDDDEKTPCDQCYEILEGIASHGEA